MRIRLAMVVPFFMASIALAQDADHKKRQLTKEQLEQLEAVDHLRASLETLEKQMNALVITRKSACLKAFGHEGFCECLNQNLAVGLTFDMYVGAVVHTKEELGYAAASSNDKKLIDNAIIVRDQCVTSVWSR